MIKIDYPRFDFRMKGDSGKQLIFDELRKRWVALTPEEWVRQNILQYLVQVKNYPASLIAVEKEIAQGELKKRFDILVYKASRPWMIIECKEMNVMINEAVIRQVLNYNITLQTDFLVVTNGSVTICFAIAGGKVEQLPDFPDF